MKTIIFTGGGTAGHITPNLAIIEELKDYKIYYLGSNGMEKEILQNYKCVQFIEIPTVKLIRSLTPKNLLIPFKMMSAYRKTKKILKKIAPDIIFSKGGYVSIPVCMAGSKLKTPIITHESDLTIGLANKIICKKAKYLCCSFKETCKGIKNSIHTGSPIRKEIFNGKKENIINTYNITTDKPIILVTGGSLGSKTINEIIWDSLDILCKNYTIIHITGKKLYNSNIKHENYIQIPFANKIEDLFDASELIVCRAGSNTIFELLSIKKPMLLIPLSKKQSRGDQILNAKNFNKKGFANMLLEENLNKDTLLKEIKNTLQNKNFYIRNMQKEKIAYGNDTIIKIINETANNE